LPEADLALLRDAVAEAADIALGFTGPDARRWDKPDDAGPVTEADLAVNKTLRTRLRAARPAYGWMSEEDPDDGSCAGAARIFIVDPIDGTRSFIDGSGTWAISVAVVEHGAPAAGVVMLPAREMVYAAARGAGATLNGDALACSTRPVLAGAELLVPRVAMNPDYWPGGMPQVTRHHRPSLAYRLCLAAQGRFDGMLTLRDAWEWDIAAGALIAAEAGCTVSDRNGAALAFNSTIRQTPGVMIAPPRLHAALARARGVGAD
jgi:myo-inositol-1(or 4)-monophosphatase